MTTTASAPLASPVAALAAVGTSIWLDALDHAMLGNGDLRRRIDSHGVVGVTANPAIVAKAISEGREYDQRLRALLRAGSEPLDAYETVAVEDVRAAADVLQPVHERTRGLDGYASLEVDPHLAHDAEATLAATLALWRRLDRRNVMIKIPATGAGIQAIRGATAAGVNVNVTLLFSVDAYTAAADAYLSGLEDRLALGKPIHGIASVASFFVSRVDAVVDRLLIERRRDDLAGRAGIANARVAYDRFQRLRAEDRHARLVGAGARAQRPLWASTAVKDPRYRDVMYVEALAGPDTVNTMPPATLDAFADHGRAHDALTGSADDAYATLDDLGTAGVDLGDVAQTLLEEGLEGFRAAVARVVASVEERRR